MTFYKCTLRGSVLYKGLVIYSRRRGEARSDGGVARGGSMKIKSANYRGPMKIKLLNLFSWPLFILHHCRS